LSSLMELEHLVQAEITQRWEEGCDITEVEQKFHALKEKSRAGLEGLLGELEGLSPKVSFPYVEPSILGEIRAVRPPGPRKMKVNLPDEELYDRIYGAWLGRCAGCLLGKPVEGWSREKIEGYLKLAGAYPLQNYLPPIPRVPEEYPIHRGGERCMLGNIQQMVRDDDTDYTILGLHILEEHGLDFTTDHVAEEWLTHFPYKQVYTAERAAYKNLVNDIHPPASAVYRNPYREWIGAQIRADIWGYVTPGMPERGAEFAFRDASLSHMKNGIYGEMFVSAMLSAAFVTNDIEKIVEVGLSEIPEGSRLAEAIRDSMKWSREFADWREAWSRVMENYGHYHRVHTINNAAIVLLGLIYGRENYEKGITISVMGGLDTDCNGATTGSILGATLGAKALPEKWVSPLNDRIESFVLGFNNSRISDLAKRTFKIAKEVLEGG